MNKLMKYDHTIKIFNRLLLTYQQPHNNIFLIILVFKGINIKNSEMLRNYQKKFTGLCNFKYTEENFNLAVKSIKLNQLSLRKSEENILFYAQL